VHPVAAEPDSEPAPLSEEHPVAGEPVDWEQSMMEPAPVAQHPFAEQPVVAEEPVMADEPMVAEEPVVADEPVVAEEPAPASEEFRPVTPSPFMADAEGAGEPAEQPWFVADVQEEPKRKPAERPVQSDTWSGRPIGS
jgi:ribonuclease E